MHHLKYLCIILCLLHLPGDDEDEDEDDDDAEEEEEEEG
jgi:hypothetical protein